MKKGAAIVLSILLPLIAEAAVSFVNAGGESGVAGPTDCAPSVPSGIANNDILLVVEHSRVTTPTHSCVTNCTGWASASNSNDATGGQLTLWWKRTTGTESAPTFDGGATESIACRMFAFRGVETTGNPWDVLGTAAAESAASPFVLERLTSTVDNDMMVGVGGSMDNNTWGPAGVDSQSQGCTIPSAGDTSCTTSNLCVDNGSGSDNSVFLAYDNTPAGTAGTLHGCTDAQFTAGPDAGRSLSLLLKPAAGAACVDHSMMGFHGCF